MKYKKTLISLLILWQSAVLSQDKPSDPRALELFIEGKTLELQNNYLAAISKYQDALKIEKAAGIYYTLSKLYNNTSNYTKALENGIEALKLAPTNPDFHENISDIYIILNDYKNALKHLLEVNKYRPDDINVLYNIGRIYEIEKQPSQALKYYEIITEDYMYDETVLLRMIEIYEAYKDYSNSAAAQEKLLQLNPSDFSLKYNLARTFLLIPDFEKALAIYEDILKLNSNNREVLTEIIKIYFRLNKNDLAFEKFGKLTQKDTVDFLTKMDIAVAFMDASSTDSTALPVAKSILHTIKDSHPEQWMPDFYLALIDIRENNIEIAEEKFKDIMIRADTSAEAHVLIGFSYYERNKFEDAARIFTAGAEKFTDDFRLNFMAGNSYYRLGMERDALPYLERAKQINPKDLNTLSTLGIIYDNLKLNDECEKLYKDALSIYPDNILLLNNYAYHLSEINKDLEKALEMSKITIEKEPENSSYLDTYGWILFKMKDYKKALKYIQLAVKYGRNSVLLEHLGDIYEAMGEIVKAIKHWKEALESSPDNETLIKKIEKYK